MSLFTKTAYDLRFSAQFRSRLVSTSKLSCECGECGEGGYWSAYYDDDEYLCDSCLAGFAITISNRMNNLESQLADIRAYALERRQSRGIGDHARALDKIAEMAGGEE